MDLGVKKYQIFIFIGAGKTGCLFFVSKFVDIDENIPEPAQNVQS